MIDIEKMQPIINAIKSMHYPKLSDIIRRTKIPKNQLLLRLSILKNAGMVIEEKGRFSMRVTPSASLFPKPPKLASKRGFYW